MSLEAHGVLGGSHKWGCVGLLKDRLQCCQVLPLSVAPRGGRGPPAAWMSRGLPGGCCRGNSLRPPTHSGAAGGFDALADKWRGEGMDEDAIDEELDERRIEKAKSGELRGAGGVLPHLEVPGSVLAGP